MSGSIIVIRPDGSQEQQRHEGAGMPPLKQLQEAVGGYIEQVQMRFEGKVRYAFVNEEGLLKNLPRNVPATAMLAREYLIAGNVLRGNVAVWIPDIKRRAA